MRISPSFALIGIGAILLSGCSASIKSEPVPAETVEVEVQAVPQACLDALTQADDLILVASDLANVSMTLMDLFSQQADISAEAIMAAAAWDSVTLDRLSPMVEDIAVQIGDQNIVIGDLTARVQQNTYQENAEACRATS